MSEETAEKTSSKGYDHGVLETRWQARWDEANLYRATADPSRKKLYFLTMLPYPSGDLHIGHWYIMTPSDAQARYQVMKGHNVMFPIGFDAFGLPAENAAIRSRRHPKEWTYGNIDKMRRQLRAMGAMWDWSREAVSADSEYYRWTQWFFLKLLEHDLAYRKRAPVDFCPQCNTTLAREQVIGDERLCERCDTPVIRKELSQWFFRITRYADELLDFSKLDWPERIQTLQRNWVGRSEGAEVTFAVRSPKGAEQTGETSISVFTTRPDTLWGVSFMVLAPEHPLVAKLVAPERRAEVEAYVAQATRQTDIQREAADREKTGVFIGAHAVNPVNGEDVPIYAADYALMTYGTGAVMGVPGHDTRDFAFAKKFGLPCVRVVTGPEGATGELEEAWTGDGKMVNSGDFDGTPVPEGVPKVIAWLDERGSGRRQVTYRLRDWLISRQRYWGAPIPVVHCDSCGPVPVPESELPVELPEDVEWKRTGENPLKLHPTWKNAPCPRCGEPGTRETDTMDTFMCSSWYQYRYLSPHHSEGPWDPKEYDYWMPVDIYTGGREHATMHLIYTRFFTKALRDMGIGSLDEPMTELHNQGVILGEDSEKMSKSRGNVVSPDELVERYGADTVRAYLMFFARWDQGGPWSSRGIEGAARWVQRVYTLLEGGKAEARQAADPDAERALRRVVHQTIKRVSDDLDRFEFNTVVAGLMELTNALYKARDAQEGSPAWEEAVEVLLKLSAPVIPHVAEELWERRGGPFSIHRQAWPVYDAAAAAEESITLIVQVNGKLRDRVALPADVPEAEAKAAALATPAVSKRIEEAGEPRKVIYVPKRLVNVVF